MIQHVVYHQNMRIFYRGEIVSISYAQDCSSVIAFFLVHDPENPKFGSLNSREL